jgi:ATP-dependent protease HslVU (ClpYQ) peptidase subunit
MINKIIGYLALVAMGVLIGVLGTLSTRTVNPQSNDGDPDYTVASVEKDEWSIWPSSTDKSSDVTKPQITTPLDVRATIKAIVAMDSQFKQFAAAHPVARRATAPQLKQLIETLISMESDPASIGIARIFYIRYINVDPVAATEHFWLTMPEESTQYRRVMYNIYHEWAWIDMEGALADITEQVAEKNRENIITFLLRDDHFTSNDVLLTLADSFSDRTRSEAMLAAASRGSNEAAFERLVALPKNSDARRHGLYRLVRRWAQTDPQGALQRLKLMVNSSDRQNLITNVISIWAQTDAEQALLVAIDIGDGNNYAYAALSTLAKTDGMKALALAEQYQDRLDNTVKNQVMQTWASADPRAAASYLEEKGSREMSVGARQIAWHYTLQYPEEAYEWAQRMGLLDDANVASNMGNALVQADLGKAESVFAELPPSASRNGLFTNIVRQRTKQNIAQTHQWLSQYKDEAKFVEAQNNLLYEWTRRDPEASAEVVLAMQDNPNKSGHLSSVASNWYDKSPESALSWLFDMPQSQIRDRTIASLAQKVGRSDVDEAISIAQEISNEQLQQNLLKQLRPKNR